MQYYRLGAGWIESSLTEKHLKVLVDKLNVSQQHTLAAKTDNCNLGWISRSIVSRARKEILLWLAAVRLHLKICVLGSPAQDRH